MIRGYGITASEERREKNTYHYYHTNEHGDIEILTNKKGEFVININMMHLEEEEKQRKRYRIDILIVGNYMII